MKKTTSLMLALLFSGAMLLGEAINTTARASEDAEFADGLKCKQLTGCKGDSGCGGQGEGSNCILDCADGAHIHCAAATEE
jgi:hypothetical protein